MAQTLFFCLAVLASSCLLAAPSVLAAEKADKLWSVVDGTQNKMGLFWTTVNVSGYVQSKKFAEIAAGNYTFLAPGNETVIGFAEQMGISLKSIATNSTIGQLLWPLIDYHVVKGLPNLSKLELKTTTSYDTMLTGSTDNSICSNVGPVNITKISDSHAVVSAGGNMAVMNLTADGPVSSNEAYAVYGIDSILSPCCLNINFAELEFTTILRNPQLRGYIAGLDLSSPIVQNILPFLTTVLGFIKENAEALNKYPFTVVLPYPSVIAEGLETVKKMDPSLLNENSFKAIFLNHVINGSVTYDSVSAAGGKQTVKTLLDVMYGPFSGDSCSTPGVTATVSSDATNATQLMPTIGGAATRAGYKLCNGGIIYFAEDLILPCNIMDAISSVANNQTSEVKARSSGTSPSPSSPSLSGSPQNTSAKTSTASPAVMAVPAQWALNMVLGLVMLVGLL